MTDLAAAPVALDTVGATTTIASERPIVAPRVSVVIPTLNEARNLPHVLALIPPWIHELIIVDGLSIDDTVAVAKEHWPGAKVLMEGTRGKGAALRAGFGAASGDIIVMLDADGSTDPREIAAFVGLLVAGADVAMGSRFAMGGGTEDMETHRRIGNWALTRLVRVGFGARFSDLCYGYTAFWRDVLPALDGPFRGFEVETVLHIRAVRAGLKIAEVPSFESHRMHGTTNLRTVRDGFRVLKAITSEWKDEHVTKTTVPNGSQYLAGRRAEPPPWHAAPAPSAASTVSENGTRMRSVGG